MKRFALALVVFALAVPSFARAEGATTYTPSSFKLGPQGGDPSNKFVVDPATGQVTVVRHQALGVSGSLGCAGTAGYAYLQIDHLAAEPVTKVVIDFNDAFIGPYAFMSASVRKGSEFLDTVVRRGAITGTGTLTLDVRTPDTGALTIWFGIQLGSSCPHVDAANAMFRSVTVTEG